jgi:MEMO1 family protein
LPRRSPANSVRVHKSMNDCPQLRPVEAFPVEGEEEQLVCLRDPDGYAPQPIFLNQMGVFLVSRMDGTNSLRDIQAAFYRASGEILPTEQLEALVAQLDEMGFLDSETFRARREAEEGAFLASPLRPAQHAGGAYADDPDELRDQICSFFSDPDGPGASSGANGSVGLRGLIAPHIDFHRGGPAYAHAYSRIGADCGADRFILFGTCHTPMRRRFALTRKDFQTPFGAAAADREFIDRLAGKLPEDYFLDEISHRGEHSLEFQAVMLKYSIPEPRGFQIVPILVGSFHDICEADKTGAEDSEIESFVRAVRETIDASPGRTLVVAGADLAHVGRRFGDESGPTESSMERVEREDREFLECVTRGDAEALFRSIAADGDSRRTCGFPPIYMAMRTLQDCKGELLKYRQWTDYESGAAVTYAALALF